MRKRKKLQRRFPNKNQSSQPSQQPGESSQGYEESDESEDELNFSSGDEIDVSTYSSRATPRPRSLMVQIPAQILSKVTAQAADAKGLSIRTHCNASRYRS